jgi:hypothetical protein
MCVLSDTTPNSHVPCPPVPLQHRQRHPVRQWCARAAGPSPTLPVRVLIATAPLGEEAAALLPSLLRASLGSASQPRHLQQKCVVRKYQVNCRVSGECLQLLLRASPGSAPRPQRLQCGQYRATSMCVQLLERSA